MKNDEFIHRIRFRLGKLIFRFRNGLVEGRARKRNHYRQLGVIHRFLGLADGVAVQRQQLRGARGIDVAQRDALGHHFQIVGGF